MSMYVVPAVRTALILNQLKVAPYTFYLRRLGTSYCACESVYAHAKSLILCGQRNSLAERELANLNVKYLVNELGKVP